MPQKIGDDFFDHIDEDLEISATDLDIEWLRQPQLFMRYSAAAAYFQKKAALAAERKKIIEAELKCAALENPDECLGEGVKPSNEKIAAYALQHPDYIEAKEAAIQAEYRAQMAQQAVFAFQQRKAALENLVQLQSMEYFSAPKTPRNIDRDFEKRTVQKTVAERISKARAKRRS